MTLMKCTSDGVVPMSSEEESAFLTQQSADAITQSSRKLVSDAQEAISKSDLVFIRCGKAGVAWPQEWQDYVLALREIIQTGVGDIPQHPSYPEGT